MRKQLAREAVIFCLIGSLSAMIGLLVIAERQASGAAKSAAMRAVHGIQTLRSRPQKWGSDSLLAFEPNGPRAAATHRLDFRGWFHQAASQMVCGTVCEASHTVSWR